jgi:hypothetical protein
MFEVKKYTVNDAGNTEISLAFDIGKGPIIDNRTFAKKEHADFYIYGSKKSYIILKFEKFVLHKKKLQNTGNSNFYNFIPFIKSLERLLNYVSYFQNESLNKICSCIVLLEKDLQNILPTQNNNSYNSSKSTLTEMISFCKIELSNTKRDEN